MPQQSPPTPSRRILVVDDEPSVCQAVRMMLEFDGHAVETAGTASQALQTYEKGEFDMVITDFYMPDMKGDALARAIKERNPDMPVVMITAHAEMLPVPLAGVECIISKPFLLENLREAIRKAKVPAKKPKKPAGKTPAKRSGTA